MGVDFNDFVRKAGKFYDTWPGLFNWAAPATLAIVGGFCWFIWWLRGHRIEMERAGLKAQNEALKAQNEALKAQNEVVLARQAQAKEQADHFKLEMEKLQSAVTTVKDQAEQGATSKDLTVSLAKANAIADGAAFVLRLLIKTLT